MYKIRESFHLGRRTYLEVRDYTNYAELVFVKSTYEGWNTTPTITEFCLNFQRWNHLAWTFEEIERAVADHEDGKDVHFKQHLGGNHYVQVNSGFKVVDLRRFWLPEGQTQIRATRKGIALNFDEFRKLVSLLESIVGILPELSSVEPCYLRSDHCNVLGALSCAECNPNGADGY
jgi:hypothetical protein